MKTEASYEERVAISDGRWRWLANPHFWVVSTMVVGGTIVYYRDYIPPLSFLAQMPIINRYDLYRMLYIIPIAYASLKFGVVGGVAVAGLVAALIMPHEFLGDRSREDVEHALTEAVAFLMSGVVIGFMIHGQKRALEERQMALASLEAMHRTLHEHARALEETYRRSRALNNMARRLASSLEPMDVLMAALEEGMAMADMEFGYVAVLHEEIGQLLVMAHRGMPEGTGFSVRALAIGEGTAGRVGATGRVEAGSMRDLPPGPLHPMAEGLGIQSYLVIPLKVQERVKGVLGLGTRTARSFSPGDMSFYEAIGLEVGLALNNAQLYEAERRESRMSEALARTLEEDKRQLEQARQGSLDALRSALESRRPYLAGHVHRVADYARRMAQHMGLSAEECRVVAQAGELHALGVIGVSDRVLDRKEPLTPQEYQEVKDRFSRGTRIVHSLGFLEGAANIIQALGERYDGSGYPHGLIGEAIPLGARIVAVANAYDSLTTDRPYREAVVMEEALLLLREGAGTHWDPQIVEALSHIMAQGIYRED
ncbi:MAG: GAF domain-containing protein [Chloroflexi bacterium]|nr:GAF domain-containing protein [Chloroflexota bacterium]